MNEIVSNLRWYESFLRTVQRTEFAAPLREAALAEQLGAWTAALTNVIAATCVDFGWRTVAKAHRADFMPHVRQRAHSEYMALDVMAFVEAHARQPAEGFRWPWPVAVFELENKRQPERLAFSLWKVLMARAPLRVVFGYCRDRQEAPALARMLAQSVLPGLAQEELANIAPGLLLVIGTRSRADDFPYGFFLDWVLNPQTGLFQKG